MKITEKMFIAPAVLLGTQAQAAVDVTGFTVESATRPYGLIVVSLLLLGIGLACLRPSS